MALKRCSRTTIDGSGGHGGPWSALPARTPLSGLSPTGSGRESRTLYNSIRHHTICTGRLTTASGVLWRQLPGLNVTVLHKSIFWNPENPPSRPDVGTDDPPITCRPAGDPASTRRRYKRGCVKSERLRTLRSASTDYAGQGSCDFARRIGISDREQRINWFTCTGTVPRSSAGAGRGSETGEMRHRVPLSRLGDGTRLSSTRAAASTNVYAASHWPLPPSVASWRQNFDLITTHVHTPFRKVSTALTQEWGISNFVNPPFRKDDVVGDGPMAFVRKAIAEQQKGKTSVLLLPVFDYVTTLLEAGAEIRSLERLLSKHRHRPDNAASS